jgi:uncharacterized protein
VDNLIVPTASITADGYEIDVMAPIAELQPSDAEGGVAASFVHVRGALTEVSGEYLFRGSISGVFEHICDRCLEAMRAPFNVDVMWTFGGSQIQDVDVEFDGEDFAEEDFEEEEAAGFNGVEINLGPSVWEEAVLAMPLKFLCSEDCAGLCPRCGTNLNRGRCACRVDDSDGADLRDRSMGNKGLAGLADLFPDLRPKRSED